MLRVSPTLAERVAPREVYKAAILSNASSIVLLHNHPSGSTKPSSQDRSLTKILREGGQLLGIPVVDHIIIGDDAYFSFDNAGLL
jgi:DNA repair protein RadC